MRVLHVSAVYIILLALTAVVFSCSPAGGGRPVINSFTADPSSVAWGGGTTLSWRVSNASGVTIDQGIGVVAKSEGNSVVYPGGNTTYKLTASNQAGSNTAMVTVVMTSSQQPVPSTRPISTTSHPPLVYNFWAEPSTVVRGNVVRLSWNVLGAESVRIEPGIGVVKLTGSYNVTPQVSTVYTLTAVNTDGTTRAAEEVHVLAVSPYAPVINWFAASPYTILQGRSSTLSWSTSNSQTVSITGIGSVPSSGKHIIWPSSTTQYLLEAFSAYGRYQDAVTVEVIAVPQDTYSGKVIVVPQDVYYHAYEVQPDYVPQFVPDAPGEPGGTGESGAD